jgi:hypothetical protein
MSRLVRTESYNASGRQSSEDEIAIQRAALWRCLYSLEETATYTGGERTIDTPTKQLVVGKPSSTSETSTKPLAMIKSHMPLRQCVGPVGRSDSSDESMMMMIHKVYMVLFY